jgi:hypothetical protein
VLPAQALRFNARGPPVTPAAMLVGALAVPLANNQNASKDDTTVPLGAPSVAFAGRPLPRHCTTSSTWQAAASKSRSAWQPDGQPGCRQV